jgi:hypothetical protein
MDYLFTETLEKLIDLKNIKMVDFCNKKVISTSIFIPEDPSVSCKTFGYFTDLIKSVETFINTGLEGWVYRIYVDDMFFSGISQKELETAVAAGDKFGSKVVEEMITSIEKESGESASSSPLKKTKKSSNIVEDKDSKYNYTYNKESSEGSISPETKKTVKVIRDKLKKQQKTGAINSSNVLRLKKMMKLLNLYLKVIQESKSPRYRNIEIVSFNCDKVKLSKKNLPGHPSTFGSIMRFLPLFDKRVDMFVSINSRLPVTPLMKHIIDYWENAEDKQKKLLTLTYQTSASRGNYGFIGQCIHDNLLMDIIKIQAKIEDKKELTPNDKLLVQSIDDIFSLKENLMSIPHEKRMSFSKINKIKSKEELKREYGDLSNRFSEFKKIGKLIGYTNNSKSPNYKIWSKSIAAGFFGMKNDASLFGERAKVFCNLLKYLINTGNKFSYGIDEVFLKLILGFECGTLDYNYGHVKYGDMGEFKRGKRQHLEVELDYVTNILPSSEAGGISQELFSDVNRFNPKNYVTNSKGNGLSVKSPISIKYGFDDMTKANLIDNPDYIISGIHNSKNLLTDKDNNNVQKNDRLTVRFLNESDEPKTEYGLDPEFLDVSFLDMFKILDEHKRFIIYDSGISSDAPFYLFIKDDNEWTAHFTRVNLKTVPLKDIPKLLVKLIRHFRNNCVNYKLEILGDFTKL